MKKSIFAVVIPVIVCAAAATQDFRKTGDYFGQKKSGSSAEPFAPGIVTAQYNNHGSVTFSPDGKEAYWAVLDYGKEKQRAVLESRNENGRWTLPRLAFFSRPGFVDDVPFISPDGGKLFFTSWRPLTQGGKTDKENIWVMEKSGAGWSAPKPLPQAINRLEDIHHQVSVDGRGNLYFGANPKGGQGNPDIYCSMFKDGEFQKPFPLGPIINTPAIETTPFIAPDGSYLIFCRFHPAGWSMFISYREKNDGWTQPLELRGVILPPRAMNIGAPQVTRDGKFLFFIGSFDGKHRMFWAEASFIEDLRPKK